MTATSPNSTSITITGTANATCNKWRYQLDNSGNWTFFDADGTTQGTIAIKTLTVAAGTHTVKVRANKVSNDVAGTSASVTVNVDATAPTVGLSVAYNGTTSITLNATANVNCKTWQYKLDSGSWTNFTTSPTGTSASQTLTITAGAHTVQVRATKASNSVVGTSSSVSVDSAAPTVSFSISNIGLTGFTISASSNVNCNKWQYKLGSESWTTFSTTNGKSASKTITGLTRNTAYTVYVRAYKTSNGLYHAPASQSVTTLTLTLSISPSSVATGSDVTLTVNNGNGISCTYTLRKTNESGTQLATGTFNTGSKAITCPKSWFTTAGDTQNKSLTVHATVTDGTTTMTKTFTLTAGSDMKPVFNEVVPPETNPSASVEDLTGNFPSKYIAGYSKVKVAAAVSSGSNATISTVKLSYPGGSTVTMTYNSTTQKYEGTTAAAITANTTFTVTVTDSRGLTASKTVSVTGVVPYVAPVINIDTANTYRCNSSGTKTDGGQYYRVKATAQLYTTNLSGNTVHSFKVQVKGSGTARNITSGTQSAAINGSFNSERAYTIVFTLQDKVSGAVTKEYSLPGAFHDFVMKRGTDGEGVHAALGMSPAASTGKSTFELPAGGGIRVNGQDTIIRPGTVTVNMPCFGFTTGGKELYLFFISRFNIGPAVNAISVTALSPCYIRHSDGGYVGTGGGDLSSYISSSSIYGGTIRVVLNNPDGWGITANTPVAGIASVTYTVT